MKHILQVLGALITFAQLADPLSVPAQPAPASPATSPADGPRIRFAETSFDFGKVKSSELVQHDFVVTNTGNAVLEITDVRPSCPGCTTALPWDRRIQPGQTGKIPIQFNSANFSGPVGKSVGVTCNDPTQPNTSLQFHATVWRPIDVQPAFVHFTSVEGETNDVKVVHISSHLDEPLTLEPPQCANPAFKTEIKTVLPGKKFELHVSYTGPISNTTAQGYITIKTSSTEIPMVNVTAQAMVQPALAVMPVQVTLPAGPLSTGHRHSQVIRNNSKLPMKLTEAAVNAEGVTVQITEPQPGKYFALIVAFPPNFRARPGEPLELTVHTSHPRHPVIKVPIAQAAAPAPVAGQPSPPAPAGSK